MPNTNIMVRRAERKDVPQLAELMKQYMEFYQRPLPEDGKLQDFIVHLLDHPDSGLQFVAESDGELSGFATLYYTFSTLQLKRAAVMNDLFVAADARGRRIGEALFQACLAYVREHHYAYMTWETARDNHSAQAFYNKMGGQRSDWVVYEIN
ncbi:GNAT family N-acetyltransferase [Paenibacillus sp. NPDC056579]|uniref:GNAT family N-acetyltransferase n=1 Tax=Paenibacillus sp. NPDC056579 TaxID=3345871 RepID=UPI00367C4589